MLTPASTNVVSGVITSTVETTLLSTCTLSAVVHALTTKVPRSISIVGTVVIS